MYISNELKVNKISFSISKNLKILYFSQVNINSNNVNLMTITSHNEHPCRYAMLSYRTSALNVFSLVIIGQRGVLKSVWESIVSIYNRNSYESIVFDQNLHSYF